MYNANPHSANDKYAALDHINFGQNNFNPMGGNQNSFAPNQMSG